MSEDTDGGLKLLLLTCFFHCLYTFKNSVKTNAESDICNLHFSLQYSLLLKYYTWLKKPRGASSWNCCPINGVKRCLCYITSVNIKQRSRRSLRHLSQEGFSERGRNYHCPSVAPVPKGFGVKESRLRADCPTRRHSLTHTDTLLIFSFLTSLSLCFYLMFSDSNTCQHRSTGHDLSLTTTRNKKMESEPGGRMAVLFCWCREFQSSLSAPKGCQ